MTQTGHDAHTRPDTGRDGATVPARRPLLGILAGFVTGAVVALALLGLLALLGARGAWVPYVPVGLGVVFLVAVSVWRGRASRQREE